MTIERYAEAARRVDGRQAAAATTLLRACLQQPCATDAEIGRLAERVSPGALESLARYHGVGGLIFQPLAKAGVVDPEIVGPARRAFEAAVHRHLRSTWELAQVARALNPIGVAWAVVKGPAAVEQLYGGGGGRQYVDLDLLVDPPGFGPVVTALEACGFRLLDRNWAVLRREMRGEVHLRGAAEVEIDLHWNLVNMYRGRLWIPTGELLRRAQAARLAGVEVGTLEATDSLVHLCLHAAISGGDRIVWLKDIERSVSLRAPEWDVLVERCAGWHAGNPVGLMLARAADFLGAAVPEAVLRALIPRGTARLISAVERVSPWPRALGRLTAANRLMARSVGQGAGGGTRWILARAIRNLDPGQEAASSAFTLGGDEQDRAAFIAAVMSSEHGPQR